MQRGHDAERGVVHVAEHVLVGEVAAADQRQALLEPGVRVLAHEAQRVGARSGRVDRVDVTPQPGEIRPVVGGAERREELLHDLTARLLERSLEGGARLVAEREVLGDDRDLPILEHLDDPRTERMRGLARRPPGAHDVLAAAALRQVLSGDGGRERRDLSRRDVG